MLVGGQGSFGNFYRFLPIWYIQSSLRRQRAGCILNSRQIEPLSYPFNLFTVTLCWSSASKIRSFFSICCVLKTCGIRWRLGAIWFLKHLEVDGSVDNDWVLESREGLIGDERDLLYRIQVKVAVAWKVYLVKVARTWKQTKDGES